MRGAYISSIKNHSKNNIKTYCWIKYHVITVSIAIFWYADLHFFHHVSLQGFEDKNLSTNLQEFLEIIVNSTMNIGSNLRSTLDWPPPPQNIQQWGFYMTTIYNGNLAEVASSLSIIYHRNQIVCCWSYPVFSYIFIR